MVDRSVADEGAAGNTPGRGEGVARAVTDVFAPQYVGLAMPPVAGLFAHGGTGLAWGLLAAALCVGVPAAVIGIGVRRGRLDSMHVVERRSRTGPMVAAFASVVAGLAVLALLDAPRVVLASAAVMLAWLLVMGPITLLWKISFHTGVAAGTTVVLAHVLTPLPVLVAGVVTVAAIGWARVRITHHTPAETVAGAVAGTAATWATLAALL